MRSWASVVLPSLVFGHGIIPGVPKLFGRNAIADLRNRNILPSRSIPAGPENVEKREPIPTVEERATNTNTNGQCGPGYGSCATGYCCSPAGWCGTGIDYCEAPGCQFYYGPGCDQNTTPPGPSTSTIARPVLNKTMPYGGNGIYDCVNDGEIALTFDDGPWIYTGQILDVLEQYNAVATFFITGNNNGKGEIDNAYNPWAGYIERMDQMGCQIASHTWSHNNLDTEFQTSADRMLNMYKNEMALRNILGKFPTYMRPPYSACSATAISAETSCEHDMAQLGYNIVYFDLDTEDYLMDSTTLIQNSKNFFSGNLSTTTPEDGSWLVIGHDIHYQTAYNLTAYMLETLLAAGYKPVTVGQCLGDSEANWYRTDTRGGVFTSANSTTAAASSTSTSIVAPTGISTTAECGGNTGLTCAGSTFGNCCSASGWCGSTSAYCGTGCQSAFGLCGSAASSVSSSTTTTVASSATSSAASPASSLPVSTSAQCGAAVGLTCKGSTFGNCCSASGWCGSTSSYCGTGCQSGYGLCGSAASSVVSSSTASPTGLTVSTNAQCGGTTGQTCLGSTFGNCCSPGGWCGSTDAYCGTGCQSAFGSCGSSTTTATTLKSSTTTTTLKSSTTTTTKTSTTTTTTKTSTTTTMTSTTTTTTSPKTTTTTTTKITTTSTKTSTTSSTKAAATNLKVSSDGKCGAASGETCTGSKYGNCCGSANTCGNVLQCVIGCQSAYGTCLM